METGCANIGSLYFAVGVQCEYEISEREIKQQLNSLVNIQNFLKTSNAHQRHRLTQTSSSNIASKPTHREAIPLVLHDLNSAQSPRNNPNPNHPARTLHFNHH